MKWEGGGNEIDIYDTIRHDMTWDHLHAHASFVRMWQVDLHDTIRVVVMA